MAQWFLQWGWAVGVSIFAVMLVMFMYRSSVASWDKARGDWKIAAMLEVGPFITFAAKVGVGAVVFMWATMYIYGAAQNSPLAQSFYNLGSAGVAAIGGTFQSYEIAMPDAPALADMVADNLPSLPTETDVRNALGVPDAYADYERPSTSADESEAAANRTAPVASNNTGSWSVGNIRSTVNQMGTTPAMGPQPQPIQGPAPAPTNTPAPVQGPAPAPTQGFITGFGGGPSAADADAAIASVGTYTVQRGDALWKISETVYGTRNKAMTICNANRTVVRDCNNLRVGMVLSIP